jgi:Cys-tRNA(Pro)/Cys-tRNA(Cys) deacylase
MEKTNVLRMLDQSGIEYQLLEFSYDGDRATMEKHAQTAGISFDRIFKTLVLKADKTGILVAAIPVHASLHLKTLAKNSGNRKATLLPLKDLQAVTGYVRGGCSPMGMKKKFPTYIDSSAQNFDKIYVNAGRRGMLVEIPVSDLQGLTDATFVSILMQK